MIWNAQSRKTVIFVVTGETNSPDCICAVAEKVKDIPIGSSFPEYLNNNNKPYKYIPSGVSFLGFFFKLSLIIFGDMIILISPRIKDITPNTMMNQKKTFHVGEIIRVIVIK